METKNPKEKSHLRKSNNKKKTVIGSETNFKTYCFCVNHKDDSILLHILVIYPTHNHGMNHDTHHTRSNKIINSKDTFYDLFP